MLLFPFVNYRTTLPAVGVLVVCVTAILNLVAHKCAQLVFNTLPSVNFNLSTNLSNACTQGATDEVMISVGQRVKLAAKTYNPRLNLWVTLFTSPFNYSY